MDYNDELFHHGIKGMKWGIRRYQNKDGSLTKAGEKRYNKEMEKLKAEKKALKETAKTRSEAQAKKAKMDKLKAEVDSLKKGEDPNESLADKKARLLKSTDPKELYKNKDLLTYNELNERVNRIDLEARLNSKIPAETSKLDNINSKMKKASETITNATNLAKSVDNAYSTFASSSIGKTVAKKMGIETPTKKFDIQKVWDKRNELSDEQLNAYAKRVQSMSNYKKNMDTLMGKNNNNNKSGMTESDVEEYINRILDEREAMK